jgi:chromosome segregation ATPase
MELALASRRRSNAPVHRTRARPVEQENAMNAVSRLTLVSLLALGLAAPARTAVAADDSAKGPVKKAAEARKEAREKLKEKRADLKDKIAEKKAAAGEATDEAKKDVKEARKEVKEARQELREAWQKLRETRKERRKERREAIKEKYGDVLDKPAVRAELRLHAWRMARLKRIRAVATSEDKKDTVARVDKLMEKEKQRHQKRMDHLKSKGGAE